MYCYHGTRVEKNYFFSLFCFLILFSIPNTMIKTARMNRAQVNYFANKFIWLTSNKKKLHIVLLALKIQIELEMTAISLKFSHIFQWNIAT